MGSLKVLNRVEKIIPRRS